MNGTIDVIQAAHDAGATVYEAAVALVKAEGAAGNKINAGKLQRALGIGHTLSSEVLKRMEQEGVVGPLDKQGHGFREVLK